MRGRGMISIESGISGLDRALGGFNSGGWNLGWT